MLIKLKASVKGYYLSVLKKLLASKDEIIAAFEQSKDIAFDLNALTAEQDELQNKLLIVSELIQQSMYENAHIVLDQTEYRKHYDGLTERFDRAKARLEEAKGPNR